MSYHYPLFQKKMLRTALFKQMFPLTSSPQLTANGSAARRGDKMDH